MKRIDSGYKLIEVLSGKRGSAETVVNVETVKFIALIEKLVFNVAYEKISVAGSDFSTHGHAIDLFKIIAAKLLQNDPDIGRIFSQPPLISFKRDKNIGNFLVRSVFQTSEQPGTCTCKCARARCKTCPFIRNVEKISGPKRSIMITDHLYLSQCHLLHNLHSLQKVIHRPVP